MEIRRTAIVNLFRKRGRVIALAGLFIFALFSFYWANFFFGLGLLGITSILAFKMVSPRFDPLTTRKIRRFLEIKRGYYSFLIIGVITLLSLFAEFIANNRALIVHYEGRLFFPTFSRVHLGNTFGLSGPDGFSPVNYRELKTRWDESSSSNWVLLPPVPYSPTENTTVEDKFGNQVFRPTPPDIDRKHFLGTDKTGRDILSRLIYGFRVAILFAIAFMVLTYIIGILIGCLMGYFGGLFDIIIQRLIEIWSNIPFIYMVIIIFSIIPATFSISTRIFILLGIMVLFSWTGMTYYMRTATYREKERDYTSAAIVLGATTPRIILNHILPNTISTIVTFMPFTVVSAISAITALDFLGLGLPPPTPSLGEMLKQGRDLIGDAPWIISSAFASLVILLTLVTFVGEAVREAFDPKKFTTYK